LALAYLIKCLVIQLSVDKNENIGYYEYNFKGGIEMDIETMKALCEPSRCRIVTLLSQRAYCVSALATMLDLSAPAVSQHLRVLRDAGIVYCEKYGYHTHYLLDKEKLAQIADSILDLTREKPDNCHKRGPNCEAAETVGCKTGRKK
jgi:DNA-binding transcriptional ArsR family regulator